jgi:hypothetical protein
MRIISDFKDYYDSVSHQYLDKEVIYKRLCHSFLLKDKWPHSRSIASSNGVSFSVDYILLGFCGSLFPAIGIRSVTNPNMNAVLYDYQSYENKVRSEQLPVEKSYKFFFRSYDTSLSSIQRFFKEDFNRFQGLFAKHNTPCFMVVYGQDDPKIVVNPILKDLDFFKVKDPYTAHQEVYQFVTGNLNQPENSMVKISDKDKISKHGFDKWSFRKMPSKK